MFWRAWFWSYLLVLIGIIVMTLAVFLAKDESLSGVSLSYVLWPHLSQVLPLATFVAALWSTAHTLSAWMMDGRWKSTQLAGISGAAVLRGWEYCLVVSSSALVLYFLLLPTLPTPSWSSDRLLERRQVTYAGRDLIREDGFVYFTDKVGSGRVKRMVIGPEQIKLEGLSWSGVEGRGSWSVEELTSIAKQTVPLNRRSAEELWVNRYADRRSALELWKRYVLPWILLPAGWVLAWIVLKGVSPAFAVFLVTGTLFAGQRVLELSGFGVDAAVLLACLWILFGKWCRYKVSAWPNL